ncbi:hypothetical protein BV898_12907 [Hypsibius exemplaris]|uniref:Uncharacterized protein n=1 Tax=Hypsibius exemplaris TaxID=2072580 RepID=A0A1W0WCJ4_HYPEX|nr:hypothetical protein BV898_12907 [Hypsibius exemplaris]
MRQIYNSTLKEFQPIQRKQILRFIADLNSRADFYFANIFVHTIKNHGCAAEKREYPMVRCSTGFRSAPTRSATPELPSNSARSDFPPTLQRNFDIGYTSFLPDTPCTIAPPSPTNLVRYFRRSIMDDLPEGEPTANEINNLLAQSSRKLTVTELNYLAEFLQLTAKNSANISQHLFH